MSEQKKELQLLIEKKLAELGVELVDLEFKREVVGKVLRLFIDEPGSVDLNRCEQVSQALSSLLDEADIIKGSYFLEVSSPGLERRLTKPEHFQRFSGHKVKLQLKEKIKERKKFSGKLAAADETGIIIETQEGKFHFNYDQIEKANLIYEFSEG